MTTEQLRARWIDLALTHELAFLALEQPIPEAEIRDALRRNGQTAMTARAAFREYWAARMADDVRAATEPE